MNPQECLSGLEAYGLKPILPQEMADRMPGVSVASMCGELLQNPPIIKDNLVSQLPTPQAAEPQRDFSFALLSPKNNGSSGPSV